jgi:cysteine desulfurase/selenocysteine lyase
MSASSVTVFQQASSSLPAAEAIRQQFPLLRQTVNGFPLAYLDNAATSQKPEAVLEAMDRFYREENANVHRGVHTLSQRATDRFEDARSKVRTFLNAREEREIVFTKGCTEAINLVAHSFLKPRLREDGVVLLSAMEHHSNIVPWQLIGARTIPIPIDDQGEILLEEYERLLDEHAVQMVGIVHVSNSIGTVNPVAQMVRLAHQRGIPVLADGAQAGPHLSIDVQALDVDFYTLSCHKHYAPAGIGVLYGKAEHLEKMPPYQGGGNMIHTVSFDKTTYADIPARFEPGTPNLGGVIGLGAAIDWIGSLSGEDTLRGRLESAMFELHRREAELIRYAQERLEEIPGVRVVGRARERAGSISFVADFAHPHDLGTILDSEGVAIRAGHHCCMPLMKRFKVPATARASFAAYSTAQEVDQMANAVRKAKEMLG